MKTPKLFKLTFWKSIGFLIVIVGLFSAVVRFSQGLGSSTHLSDSVPWGLWIGFDFIGVGLAAAGFTIAATAHIFNNHKFEPIARPAILTAYIGYIIVVLLLVIDLGKPENFWHPLVMWNIHSVMFEITWCVICYSTVLTLEFAPVILEKFKLKFPLKLVKKITIPVVIMGVLFSTLHQSSFGSLYLIAPGKVYPLWYSSLLPLHFFISCIAAGLAMIIFESFLTARALNQSLNTRVITSLGKGIFVVLIISGVIKFADILIAGKLNLLFVPVSETYMFWLEIILGTIIPVILLSSKKLQRNRTALYFVSIITLSGFMLNRLNVSITSLVRSSGQAYLPSFEEISITLMLIILGMYAFKLITKHFAVFEKQPIDIKIMETAKPIKVKDFSFNK